MTLQMNYLFNSVTYSWGFATTWTMACQTSLLITNSQSYLKLKSVNSVMPSNHLILCRPLLLLPPIIPASGYLPMSQLFASDGQNIVASASASVLATTTQDWFLLGLTGLTSLQSKGPSRIFSNTIVQKHEFFGTQLSSQSNSHIHTWLLETIALTRWTFVGKVMSLLLNMLSRLVIGFPKSKCLLLSWLQSPSAVIL